MRKGRVLFGVFWEQKKFPVKRGKSGHSPKRVLYSEIALLFSALNVLSAEEDLEVGEP